MTSSQSQQPASGSLAEDRAAKQQDNAGHPPPEKMPKLFANYHRGNRVTTNETKAAEQFGKYLTSDKDASATDCLQFWKHNRSAYDKLVPVVLRTLAVPTSSAPVKRIFSHGGIFLRTNRARMSDKLLSN